MEVLEIYRGWNVYWTGWKSSKILYKPTRNQRVDRCIVCGAVLAEGDFIVQSYNQDNLTHWSHKDEPNYLYGQALGWLLSDDRVRKAVYANAPNNEGPYRNGDMFKIEYDDSRPRITDETPDSELEAAKTHALGRVKLLIDNEEANPSGFWDPQPAAPVTRTGGSCCSEPADA